MSDEVDPRQDQALFAELLAHREPALFLDFDGTLSPLVSRPEAARALPLAVEAVGRLMDRMPVALVTGRGLADIRQRAAESGLDADRLLIAGSHGFEVQSQGLGQPPVADQAVRDRLEAVLPDLRAQLEPWPGVLVEPKGFAIAVHWRHVPADEVAAVEAVVDQLAGPGLRKTHGKMVFELRPDLDWHKGRVVSWLLERLGGRHWPIFVGDDVTDIDGLNAVAERGTGIAVGDAIPPGHARYRLPDPAAVAAFLSSLAGMQAAA